MLKKIISKYREDMNLYNNIIGTIILKFFSLLFSIISIRAYNHYFCGNAIVNGVWLTIISILSWVVNFDLGLGNGLRNRMVNSLTLNDKKGQKVLVSSAYILITLVSIIIILVCSILIYIIDWNMVLQIDVDIVNRKQLCMTIQIALVGLVMQFVLKLIISILYALKKTALGSMVPVVSNLLIFVFAFMFSNNNPGQSLIVISIAYSTAMIIPLIAMNYYIFNNRLLYAKPSIKYYDHKCAVDVLSLGGQFFGIQILLLVINSTNDIIITQLAGPSYVVNYAMYFRFFSAIIALFTVLTNPIWSSVSECFYRKDYVGIVKAKKLLSRIAVIFVVGTFCVGYFIQIFIDFLYGKEIMIVDKKYTLIFVFYTSIMIMINSLSGVANGINCLKPQMIGNVLAAILKFPIILILWRLSKEWIVVVLGNALIMGISYLIQKIGLSYSLRKLKE